MGCIQGKAHGIHAYYDPTGRLVTFEHPKKHSPKRELTYVSTNDSTKFNAEDECFIISTIWHTEWIDFVMKKTSKPPGEITNTLLLQDKDNLRPGLKPRKDYRPINKLVWEFLFRLYGGGPVITFKVPGGYELEQYMKGTWVKKVMLTNIVTIVHPNGFPQPTKYQLVQNPMAAANAEIAGAHMMNDLSRAKFKQAKEMQKEINQGNADMIGASMMKDVGKKKMEEARALEAQQHQEMSGSIAHHFSGGLANKKMEQAKAAQKEAETAQQAEAASLFAKGNIKKNFKEALKAKRMKEAQFYAATMLKNAWRGKQAKRRVREMKEKKQRLLEEAMARKLQSKYRSRLAKRRVEALKAEKQRLREEGSAIIVQSNWRIKKAREKVTRLKIEKQRLLEEGAALKVQSRWRIRKATQRVSTMKTERNAKLARQEAARIRIGRLIRQQIAMMKLRKLVQLKRSILIITLHEAKDINIGDVNSSDPYVLLHAEYGKSKNNFIYSDPTIKNHDSSLSIHKSHIIYNTLHPVWNEHLAAVNVSGADKLVLTLMDKDNLSADDFLGQACIDLQKYPGIFAGRNVDLKNLPLEKFSVGMHDIHGKAVSLSNTDVAGKGTIDVSIRMAPRGTSHCIWMMKRASHMIMLGSAQYKARFILLKEHEITYYDSEHTLDAPRGKIKCSDVSVLEYGQEKGAHESVLHIQSHDEDWYFHWMADETSENQQVWLRKLQLCCPHVSLNGVKSSSLLERTESSVGAAGAAGVSPNTVKVKNSGKIGRRASNLFGMK